jgi:hypothetical protein
MEPEAAAKALADADGSIRGALADEVPPDPGGPAPGQR